MSGGHMSSKSQMEDLWGEQVLSSFSVYLKKRGFYEDEKQKLLDLIDLYFPFGRGPALHGDQIVWKQFGVDYLRRLPEKYWDRLRRIVDDVVPTTGHVLPRDIYYISPAKANPVVPIVPRRFTRLMAYETTAAPMPSDKPALLDLLTQVQKRLDETEGALSASFLAPDYVRALNVKSLLSWRDLGSVALDTCSARRNESLRDQYRQQCLQDLRKSLIYAITMGV